MISVITPTFNSEKQITVTVESVIKQKFSDFEHLIIDNESSDTTIDIITRLYETAGLSKKLRVLREKDKGISDAFNKGIANAAGNIILILNSDDSLYNDNIFNTITEIFRDPAIQFVHGNMYFVDDRFGTNLRRPLLCNISKAMPFNHPGMFVRKMLYDNYGVFNTDFRFAMDYELFVRLELKMHGVRRSGYYYKDDPIAVVMAGGVSWKYEIESINETRRALMIHSLWDNKAKWDYFIRIFRIRLKIIMDRLSILFIIRLWRKFKWQ